MILMCPLNSIDTVVLSGEESGKETIMYRKRETEVIPFHRDSVVYCNDISGLMFQLGAETISFCCPKETSKNVEIIQKEIRYEEHIKCLQTVAYVEKDARVVFATVVSVFLGNE
ncbi:hypothetical protein Tsp_04744 [Trichinella spiralis]|uniref:hypothetical protein n=1 Tax=Trichinella spiralis TaxID=6334 RepID=UPI0001EFDBE7|nr:hypothetical protein Tsp_04744 [Trichinella spiralis]